MENIHPGAAKVPANAADAVERVYRLAELPKILGIGRTKISEEVAAGRLQLVFLGKRAKGAFASAVLEYQNLLRREDAERRARQNDDGGR